MITSKRNPALLAITLLSFCPLPHPALSTTFHLYRFSYSSYEWSHVVGGFLWLTSFLSMLFFLNTYFLFIYLFIWLCWVLVAACGIFSLQRMSFSSCGAWVPECVGSVVVACGLSCPVACGILVPWPGMEPAFPALEGRFLTTGPPGKSP